MFHLRRLACAFKHPGFAAEREWRSVDTISPHDHATINLQVMRGLLTPYTPMLTGSNLSSQLPLVELRVGYSTSAEKAIHGAMLLLHRFGYADARLEKTQIPYTR
jgi:hypothetical protein